MAKLIQTVLIFCLPLLLLGQSPTPTRTFKASIIAGFNASQIDGDQLAGFHKLGMHLGARVSVKIAKLWEPSIEILFSQKGSRNTNDEGIIYGGEFNYAFDYVEVPILMNYRDDGFMLNAGLSYGRLVQLKEIMIAGVEDTETYAPFYRNNDFMILAGIGYFFNDHFGISVRWSRSIFSIADYKATNLLSRPQILRTLSFRGIYTF